MPTDKIIFLDIDGPMIPNTSFLFHRHASYDQVLDDRCVRVLRKILDESGAKIVFNTTHNTELEPSKSCPGLRGQFRKSGFTDSDFHEYDHTCYPCASGRLGAIEQWLERYRTDQMLWVAFDDAPIEHKRAYRTNPDLGIGIGEYNHSAKYLMFKSFRVL